MKTLASLLVAAALATGLAAPASAQPVPASLVGTGLTTTTLIIGGVVVLVTAAIIINDGSSTTTTD